MYENFPLLLLLIAIKI